MIDVIETKYSQLREAAARLMGTAEATIQQRDAVGREIATLTDDIQVLTYTTTALDQLLKAVSLESLESVESLVTYGLRTIFDDQALSFRIDVSTKFRMQWMEPRLKAGEVEASILDAFGGGPATVVAFLLRVLVCRRLGLAPVIVLDEPFAMVSADYTENVAKLLRELCDKLGFTILLVTHDPSFVQYAHHAYEAVETSHGTTFKHVTR